MTGFFDPFRSVADLDDPRLIGTRHPGILEKNLQDPVGLRFLYQGKGRIGTSRHEFPGLCCGLHVKSQIIGSASAGCRTGKGGNQNPVSVRNMQFIHVQHSADFFQTVFILEQ